MKVEQAKQTASKAIEQLSQAPERGHSETLREYLAAMARFHRYLWHNIMLIASEKPTATHVAGFHAWHRLGRLVKRGEKGILILAPTIRRKTETNDQTEPDDPSTAVHSRVSWLG
jgi:N-terminal domain of anti-restriction factor ArdC